MAGQIHLESVLALFLFEQWQYMPHTEVLQAAKGACGIWHGPAARLAARLDRLPSRIIISRAILFEQNLP